MSKNWISVHIFYTGNTDPLIVDCIAPLIERLRAGGLIRRYFFIRYWMEGLHVRLRLLPAENVAQAEIKQIIDPVISDYLKQKPALYTLNEESVQPLYKKFFIAEYGEKNWVETYGIDGVMPFRPNNSFHYIDYEPEYDRYGGVEGVELAEWHFEKSSDIVIQLIRETNIHVRTILLGQSIRLMLPFYYVFLEDDNKVISFLDRFIWQWYTTYYEDITKLSKFDKNHMRMADNLRRRIASSRSYVVDGRSEHFPALERAWAAHLWELRDKVRDLVEARMLVFPSKRGGQITVDSLESAYSFLLNSYIHMTNNRLGARIPDEVYISYLIKRSLEMQHLASQEVTP